MVRYTAPSTYVSAARFVASRNRSACDPLFALALRLQQIALKDEYFIARKPGPNVDFYSGVIYGAPGIPRSLFTVMFAVAQRGLDRPLAGNDRGTRDEDRPAPAALHGAGAPRLPGGRQALEPRRQPHVPESAVEAER
jgi:Citrate synthase, C-terminal domain